MRRADLVFCADYHTFRPAQATCLALLEALARSGQAVLLLELALTAHQCHLDAWTRGELTERELLARLDYARTWGFGWAGYRPLFEFARDNAIPILGLNGPGTSRRATLVERDAWAASVIASAAARHPDARLLVLAGDLHLAPGHLPARTTRALAERGLDRRSLVVLQNAEAVYWRLSARGAETDAVELADGRYCVFSGTPSAKIESYLTWLEGSSDAQAPDAPGHGGLDYTDRILNLVGVLASFLDVPAEGADAFTLYTAADPSFAPEMRRRAGTRALLSHAVESDVFLVPGINALFLARLDLGHAAAGAAELLLELGSPQAREAWQPGAHGFFLRAERRALASLGALVLDPGGRPPDRGDRAQKTLVAHYTHTVLRSLHDRACPLPESAFDDDLRLGLAISRAVGDEVARLAYARFRAGLLRRCTLARRFVEPPPARPRAALARLAHGAARSSPPTRMGCATTSAPG